MSIRDGRLLYHLTALDNLESIITHGLMSRSEIARQDVGFVDTANHEILGGRERLGLAEYVPFHFHTHAKYDTLLKRTRTDTNFIYLCIHRNFAKECGFQILPIHPTSAEQPELFSYDEGFARIDWDVMELRKCDPLPEGVTDQQRSLVRMAECLSPITLQMSNFLVIEVKDEETAETVEEMLTRHAVDREYLRVNVVPTHF